MPTANRRIRWSSGDQAILVIGNFTEDEQTVAPEGLGIEQPLTAT